LERIARQQRRLRMHLVEIFDDGERLNEHVTGIELQRRHAHLRVDRAVFRLPVEAALLLQVNGDHLAAQALEVERDAHPVGRGRAKIGIKLHVSSVALRTPSLLDVMRGLDPRIHLLREMDCRVKPGNDRKEWPCTARKSSGAARCQILPPSISATSSAERLVNCFMARSKAGRSPGPTTSASLFMNSSALGASSS